MRMPTPHQYIDRRTGRVVTERLVADRLVNFLYSRVRERHGPLFRALTSSRATEILGYLNFDLPLRRYAYNPFRLAAALSVNLDECLLPPEALDTPRKFFERRIDYRRHRPMNPDPGVVVSPADARMLCGSFREQSLLFIKEKFFDLEELLGGPPAGAPAAFEDGDFAVFRLTPDKYHYNHTPVSGTVVAFQTLSGDCHACNPGAVVDLVTPYSKNRRAVTIIDTDVAGGSRVGRVAMIEVAALMIGDIVQCYSERGYRDPRRTEAGMTVLRGRPKSLFRPGSSVVVLLFQKGRVTFSADIVANLSHPRAVSRFSRGFGQAMVETEVRVRSPIGKRSV